MQHVEKSWGYEEILVNEPEYCAKRLHISPGGKSSLHYHDIKKETFIVEFGLVCLEIIGAGDRLLKEGEFETIRPLTAHRFSSMTGAVILEISTHHSDDDVARIEPSGEIR